MCELVHYRDLMRKAQTRSANSIWHTLERRILCSWFVSAEQQLSFREQSKIFSVNKTNKHWLDDAANLSCRVGFKRPYWKAQEASLTFHESKENSDEITHEFVCRFEIARVPWITSFNNQRGATFNGKLCWLSPFAGSTRLARSREFHATHCI